MDYVTVFHRVTVKTKSGERIELDNCTVDIDCDSFSMSNGNVTYWFQFDNIDWIRKVEQ